MTSPVVWDRIRSGFEFKQIYAKGKKHFTPTLGLFALMGASQSGIRIGVVASAAKVGNAVHRNRAKRRLRALAKQTFPPNVDGGYDFVLIATPQTVDAEFSVLQKDLHVALRRLKLLRHEVC